MLNWIFRSKFNILDQNAGRSARHTAPSTQLCSFEILKKGRGGHCPFFAMEKGEIDQVFARIRDLQSGSHPLRQDSRHDRTQISEVSRKLFQERYDRCRASAEDPNLIANSCRNPLPGCGCLRPSLMGKFEREFCEQIVLVSIRQRWFDVFDDMHRAPSRYRRGITVSGKSVQERRLLSGVKR